MVNNAPGTVLVGAPGSGKTFALLNIAANCLGMGQRVIAIDPKNDFDKLHNVNPAVNIIDINKIRPGALNPFEFLKKIDEKGRVKFVDTATLMTIIEIMCGKLDRNTIIGITPIVTDFVTKAKTTGDYYDMQDVADYLYANQNESAQTVGTMLKMFEDNTYGKLLFTRETNVKPLVLSSTDSMVISLHGLSLPDYSKKPEDYDANERFTSAILYIITSKLLDILSGDNKIPTTLICDEAHLLFGNKEMGAIIDRFLVLGRSLNVATVLASQGISHFPKGIANYITTKFMFKSSMEEARLFLDAFDTSKINPSSAIDVDSIVSSAVNFPTGTCFMVDRANKNGIIRIKSIYSVDLLTSNPFAKSREEDEEDDSDDTFGS
jgi:type IV secretory pathway VirB4 component